MTIQRCHARDANNARCERSQEDHPTVITKDGHLALSHRTKHSWWVERKLKIVR